MTYWIIASMVITGLVSALVLWRMRLAADPDDITPDGSGIVVLTMIAAGILSGSFALSDNAWGIHGPTFGVVAVGIGAFLGLISGRDRDLRGNWRATAIGAIVGGGSVLALYGAGTVLVVLVFAFVSL